jgi:hypothetical protein
MLAGQIGHDAPSRPRTKPGKVGAISQKLSVSHEDRLEQDSAREINPPQAGAGEVGTGEVSATKVGRVEVGKGEIGAAKLGASEIGTAKAGAAKRPFEKPIRLG